MPIAQDLLLEELQKLADLRDSGAITDAEFDRRAGDLLTGSPGGEPIPPPEAAPRPAQATPRPRSAWTAIPDPDGGSTGSVVPAANAANTRSLLAGRSAQPPPVGSPTSGRRDPWTATPDVPVDRSTTHPRPLSPDKRVARPTSMSSSWVAAPGETDHRPPVAPEVPSRTRRARKQRRGVKLGKERPAEPEVDITAATALRREPKESKGTSSPKWMAAPDISDVGTDDADVDRPTSTRSTSKRRRGRHVAPRAPQVTPESLPEPLAEDSTDSQPAAEVVPDLAEIEAEIEMDTPASSVALPEVEPELKLEQEPLSLSVAEADLPVAPVQSESAESIAPDIQESFPLVLPEPRTSSVVAFGEEVRAVPELLEPAPLSEGVNDEDSIDYVLVPMSSSYWDLTGRVLPDPAAFGDDDDEARTRAAGYWDLTGRVLPPDPRDSEPDWPYMRPGGYWDRSANRSD